MTDPGEVSPQTARDAAGLVRAMRQLKESSGLTYRELEERAARSGDVLARSTLADVLRRTSLPRPEVLAAFVRACGDGRRTAAWLEARDRIAAGTAAAPADGPGPEDAAVTVREAPPRPATEDAAVTAPGPAPEAVPPTGRVRAQEAVPPTAPEAVPPAGPGEAAEAGDRPRPGKAGGPWPLRGRGNGRGRMARAALLAVPLLALAAWGLLPDRADQPGAPAAGTTTSRTPVDGWVTIRPAGRPGLCLTDGRDRRGAYASAVAVQLPCARATVPRTYLEPVGDGLYRIQWHHPQEGKGCLTVMSGGPVKGMLEPWDDCGRATSFRLAATSDDGAEGFRLLPAHSDRCVGIAGDGGGAGAEAVAERCTGAADQRFLVRAG